MFTDDTVHSALSLKFSRCAMVHPCFTGYKFTLLPDQAVYSSVLMTEGPHTRWNVQVVLQEPDGGMGLAAVKQFLSQDFPS